MLIYKNKTMITKLENELQSIMIDFSKTTNNAERKQLIQRISVGFRNKICTTEYSKHR